MELTLSKILRAATNIAGAQRGSLQLATGGELRLVSTQGFRDDFTDFFQVVRAGGSACGAALASRTEMVVSDVETSRLFDPVSRETVLRAGVRSVVSIPLLADERLIGVLSTHQPFVGSPPSDRLVRLRWLCGEAGRILDGTGSGLSERALDVLARS